MVKKVIPFTTAYGEKERKGFETTGESLTQQHFAEETEINNIIAYHDRTGVVPNIQKGIAQYGDFSEVNGYRESLDIIRAADEAFMAIPSDIRKKFDNNAIEFMEFATNPANKDELVKMGLAVAPEAGDTSASPAPVETPTPDDRSEAGASTVTT